MERLAPAGTPRPGPVVTMATLRAAERLDISARSLAVILGVSEATLSRMKKGDFALDPKSKAFEIAVLFIRMFRSLDAIVGGDESVARHWLAGDNIALGASPRAEDRQHSRPYRCHRLSGRPPRCRLSCAHTTALYGAWSRRSTSSRL